MLNLRGVYASDRGSPSEVGTERASDLHFASQVVGNLGAPLQVRPLFGGSPSSSDRSEGSSTNLHATTRTVVEPRSIGGSATLADTDAEGGDADAELVGDLEHGRDHPKDYEVVEVCRDPLSAGLGWHPVDSLNAEETRTHNTDQRGEHAV